MLFNSLHFLFFFPVVFIIFYLLRKSQRKFFLLVASSYFYMSFVPEYILILVALIVIDFFIALKIEKSEGGEKKYYLFISILSSLAILFFFKYFNFFNENIANLANFIGFNYSPWLLSILLPLGLSFHVFQSLSYVIEVYKGRYVAEKNIFTYALYVLFFPQLVAGPIERPSNLLPQLGLEKEFNPILARQGLEQMLWGFFKKLVIADQIAVVIDPYYQNIPTESSILFIVAILFSIQLYCDFSGYSDIAIGSAKMLGLNLQINFNRPFVATSLADFWRRWHISLSSWLRDYLYYPIIFLFKKKSSLVINLSTLTTFILIGLWHGANWNFVFFGFFHGIYLVFESLVARFFHYEHKIPFIFLSILSFLKKVYIFLLVSFSFIIFRSEDMDKFFLFISHLFTFPDTYFIKYFLLETLSFHVGTTILFSIFFSIIIMFIVELFQEKQSTFYIFDKSSKTIRIGWYYFLVSYILLFGNLNGETFIYFQF